jgi:hypothetical protein
MAKKSQDLRSQQPKFKKTYPVEHISQESITAVSTKSTSRGLEYWDNRSRQREWLTEAQITLLGKRLLDWALNSEDADKLQTFFAKELIASSTVNDAKEKFEGFRADIELARELIACRLWSGGLNRKYDPGLSSKYLPCYDKEYREETERMAKLRIEEKNAEQNKTFKVLVERYTEDAKTNSGGNNDAEL